MNPETGGWELFDDQTRHNIEAAHNDGLLKVKVSPSNPALLNAGRRGEYLIIVHSRLMVDINTGKNFQIQRSMPKITFQVLEVGAVGPGDQATTSE